MGIFSRTRDIIAANVTDLLDRAEDPEKMIRQIIFEMNETLVEVRASAARTIADQKEMRRHIAKLESLQDSWKEKAELALSKDREDLATAALVEKQKAGDMADKLKDVDRKAWAEVEKNVLLQTLDHHWKDHLATLDALRQVIHLRSYAQKKPIDEYKQEAFLLFERLLISIREDVTKTLMRANLARLYRRREVLTLDPRDARVRLSRLEPLGGLDVDRFLGVIEELLDSLDLFRDAVEDRSRGPDPSPHGSIRLP